MSPYWKLEIYVSYLYTLSRVVNTVFPRILEHATMYVTVNSEHAPFVESKIAKKEAKRNCCVSYIVACHKQWNPKFEQKPRAKLETFDFSKPEVRITNNNGSIFFKRQHDHVRFIRCWTIMEETRGKTEKKRYNYTMHFKAKVLKALKANGGNISKTARDKAVSVFLISIYQFT